MDEPMCRLAAYLGPDIALHDFLFAPPHGLPAQARAPRELLYGDYNADGFGIGWYADGRPQRYVASVPIWHDANLPAVARSLHQPLWLGFVRSATPGFDISPVNTQPFADDVLLFTHNGFIDDFHEGFKPYCLQYLAPSISAGIMGNTDSEYLFALLRQRLAEEPGIELPAAVDDVLSTLQVSLRERVSLLNLVVTDGIQVIAARHATNHECPSLYFTQDDPHFPDATVVASEPLTEHRGWQAVPPHNLLILRPGAAPYLTHL